ncbi:MAG TPA: ATPase domain-containing protein, partial [Oxalicibacterium sp.]|nr:ATPase domain-containing protein [Oxalicibacterium sp.]
PQRKALFFTVLGKPPLKLLRYQQQYAFYDLEKVGTSIRYVNLGEDLRNGNFAGVLDRIMREVEDFSPSLVFVDSFRSVVQTAKDGNEGIADLQHFIQELGTRMTSWEATTFLIGEYMHAEAEANPIMTVADGLLYMSQHQEQNSVVRKMRIVKMRGQEHLSGSHIFRITRDGVRIYPRILPLITEEMPETGIDRHPVRIPTGTPQLDEMLHGGLPRGHALLVVGPSGSGKTIFGTEFLAEGVRQGEKGVAVFFEKTTSRLRNSILSDLVQSGDVSIIGSRLLDLTVEELIDDLIDTVRRTNAKRVLVDSLSEFALYLAPEFRSDIRGAIFRLLDTLAKLGVTVVVTIGMEDRFTDLRFSQADISFLTDAIIAMRYVEKEGRLAKLISVVKVRGSGHSRDLREYEITDRGLEIGERLIDFEGLLSGHPSMRDAKS